MQKARLLALGLLLVMTGCGTGAPEATKIPTAQDIEAKIVRTAERKGNGVFYAIEDRITDEKGDTWRVFFLKIFRQSGKVYNFVQIRVDPRYTYAISSKQPLQIKLGAKTLNLPNESQERNRVGYYEVTQTVPQLEQAGNTILTLTLEDNSTRTLTIDQGTLKGWQKVNSIAGPNVFYPGANY